MAHTCTFFRLTQAIFHGTKKQIHLYGLKNASCHFYKCFFSPIADFSSVAEITRYKMRSQGIWMMAPALISCIVWWLLPISACLGGWLAGDLFDPWQVKANEQAGTVQLIVVLLSPPDFCRQHRTSFRKKTKQNKNHQPTVQKRIKHLPIFFNQKTFDKRKIHRWVKHNSKQNREWQSLRLWEVGEVKFGIKNRPPWAQGKLWAPTPQDSPDNSPSAGDTQALWVCSKAPSFGFILPVSSFLLPFDHPDTATTPSPHSAHHRYAGDDYSPQSYSPASCFFSIH